MSDRELLEAAAKAAGLDVRWYDGKCLRVADKCNGYAGSWNPLTDDGDALRLAVKLFITVTPGHDRCTAAWWGGPLGITRGEASILSTDGDIADATRRAIVRAAAALAGDTGGEAAK